MPQVQIPDLGTVEFPDSMSMDEINAKAKDLYTNRVSIKAKAHLDTLQPGASTATGAVARKAAANQRGIAMQQSEATYQQEVADAKGRAYGQAAEMLPFVAAAPFTGGMSVAGGAALMGAAGVAGGLARETVKAKLGSSEIPQTPKELATTLGVDAVTGMAGEVIGRGIGKVLKETVPALIKRSAVKYEMGRDALQRVWDEARGKLDALTANKYVDVTSSYMKFYDEMATLPKGTGKTGEMLTAFKEKVDTLFNKVGQDLNIAHGSPSNLQRLDALIEMKGQVNAIAWDKELNQGAGRQMRRVKQFAANLDSDIRAGLRSLPDGEEAVSLFNQANSSMKILNQQSAGIIMTENALKQMFSRGTIGVMGLLGAGGAAYGYRKGGLQGAIQYGAEGAALGAARGVAKVAIPKISTWLFEYMANHPKTADDVRKAVSLYVSGEEGKASALMGRAAMTADVRDAVKEMLRHSEVFAPTIPPE